jgi:hypothetical protein
VRCVWFRHDLETVKKRLKALEAKVVHEGLILTEAQVVAFEKARTEKKARGEFESENLDFTAGLKASALGRQHEGRRARLPADLRRHRKPSGWRQAVGSQDPDYRSRTLKRSGGAVIR